jgi:ubiquinone/menaquinone biosynthesis C-methylase UbiE
MMLKRGRFIPWRKLKLKWQNGRLNTRDGNSEKALKGMKKENVLQCYDLTADAYAAELFDELSKKPLDRLLLKQFAADNKNKGKMIDLGCGPGQTTRFLADNGVKDIIGTDLSPGMIAKARELSPDIQFQTADMLNLDCLDGSFASAVAFYAIVHFTIDELALAFGEIYRVLQSGGEFLLSFHIGDDIIHRDEFFGEQVDIDFYFFQTNAVISLLKEAGFEIISAIERYPYADAEHPSKRAYLWVIKTSQACIKN